MTDEAIGGPAAPAPAPAQEPSQPGPEAPLAPELQSEEFAQMAADAFAPPSTPSGYDFSDLRDADPKVLLEVGQALHSEGVPAGFATMARQEISRIAPAIQDDASFELAVQKCRFDLDAQFGQRAPEVIKDALAYFDRLGRHASMTGAVDALLCSPWALASAAHLERIQRAKKGR
ncbi:hypothetical protein [Rhodoligotrophos defluvii]|uniref:hypothetical protein n=1 Tax=Rhodoligotrophos defluvii TaxID=2561934 RepID=UPI0010C97F9C|nr:hypothetical protein [Rhodoligotrophos defluvii]